MPELKLAVDNAAEGINDSENSPVEISGAASKTLSHVSRMEEANEVLIFQLKKSRVLWVVSPK